MIALRRADDPIEREQLADELASLDLDRAEAVIRAFSLYFQLVNLAEERQRVRSLARRARVSRSGVLDQSLADAIRGLRRMGRTDAELDRAIERLAISPVLTAHPTEARRRTLVALRRLAALLERLDDPRLTPAEDGEIRRLLREEITILWRTSDLRTVVPSPLDEVRTAMAFFDATLFTLVPRLYRAMDAALDDRPTLGGPRPTADERERARRGCRRSCAGGRGSGATATATRRSRPTRPSGRCGIQADHVMHGYEAVATRLMQTISPEVPGTAVARALASRLARDAEELPETDRQLRRRFPDEPYRQRFGFIAERIRRTRAGLTGEAASLTGRYHAPEELGSSPSCRQRSPATASPGRLGRGPDLRWQLATFGFHLASLEVRQHAAVHRAALEALVRGDTSTAEVAPNVSLDEVLATPVHREAQARFGEAAAHRYVVSFTASSRDVTDVLDLARFAGEPVPTLDVVPLFESADALASAGPILERSSSGGLPRPPRGSRQPAGGDAGLLRLEQGVGVPRRELDAPSGAGRPRRHRAPTWRGADPVPRSWRRHWSRRWTDKPRDPARRPDQSTAASSSPSRVRSSRRTTPTRTSPGGTSSRWPVPCSSRRLRSTTRPLARPSPRAGRSSTSSLRPPGEPIASSSTTTRRSPRSSATSPRSPSFEPSARIAARRTRAPAPARPRRRSTRSAIRGPSPGRSRGSTSPAGTAWAALEAYRTAHGEAGLDVLARLYRSWPFLNSILDNAELSLAKADVGVARLYARLATNDGDERRWATIEAEHAAVRFLLRVTGRDRLLDDAPVLQRSITLRNPYVDSLSELQVRLLARLRSLEPDDPARETVLRLVQLTVNGVAAGLQNTG